MEDHGKGTRLPVEFSANLREILPQLLLTCLQGRRTHLDPVLSVPLSRTNAGLRNFLALEEQVELTLQLKSIAVPIRVLRTGGLTVETTGLKEPLPGRELSWVDQGFHGGEVFQQS
jgi:predicted amidophosphoribosyltransferase